MLFLRGVAGFRPMDTKNLNSNISEELGRRYQNIYKHVRKHTCSVTGWEMQASKMSEKSADRHSNNDVGESP
jgi:hypothetical protein